jgi:hypothetical protein
VVAFAALERVGAGGRVIFSDIAQGPVDRCRCLAPLDDPHGVADACVDAVLERPLAGSVAPPMAARGDPRPRNHHPHAARPDRRSRSAVRSASLRQAPCR